MFDDDDDYDVTPTLTSISPLITGQLHSLTLSSVTISSSGVGVLVHSLTSPQLHTLKLLSTAPSPAVTTVISLPPLAIAP